MKKEYAITYRKVLKIYDTLLEIATAIYVLFKKYERK